MHCARKVNNNVEKASIQNVYLNAMRYRSKYWPINVNDIKKMESTQVKMFQMIYGKTLKDGVKRKLISKRLVFNQ